MPLRYSKYTIVRDYIMRSYVHRITDEYETQMELYI